MTTTIEKITAYAREDDSYSFAHRDPKELLNRQRTSILQKYIGRSLEDRPSYTPTDWEAENKKNLFGQKLKDPKAFDRGYERGFHNGAERVSEDFLYGFIKFYDDISRELKKVDDNAKALEK